jgi:hypothetical protein
MKPNQGTFAKEFCLRCNIPPRPLVLRSKNQFKLNFNLMNNNVAEVLMAPSVLGTLGLVVYFFTKTMTDYILKKKMIDKGFVNDDTQAIFKQQASELTNKYSSLKWGMIVFFAGLSLIIMEFIEVQPDSPLPYGLFAVSVSLGFLIYYFMVKQDSN